MQRMKKAPVAPDVIKYVKARSKGYNKSKSKEIAGYSPETKAVTIERSEPYKALTIKDSLLKHISLDEITLEHMQNIKSVDRSVANTAIMTIRWIHPRDRARLIPTLYSILT